MSGGPSVTLGLPAGELEASAAASASDRAPGAAGSLAYSWVSRRLGAGAFVRGQAARYATVSLRPIDDRAAIQAGGFVGVPIGSRLTATAEYTASRYRDTGVVGTIALRGDVSLGSGVSLSVNASEQRAPASTTLGVFAALAWSVGHSTVAAATAQSSRDSGTAGGVEVQRSLPAGPGYGYRLHAGAGPLEHDGGVVQVQSSFGRCEVSYDRFAQGSVGYAEVAGGAVAMDGGVFFTRPVQDGFALIQVPDVPGVRGYLNNQEVGRTDRNGNLLVPALQPYYGNRLSISEKDIPFDYDIRETERLVASPMRGGALVRFAVERINSIGGKIVVERDGAPASPAYGELTLVAGGRVAVSPIAGDGRFYLQNVAPGRHPARVEYADGECMFELEVPASSAAQMDLGEVRCRHGGGLARGDAQRSSPAVEAGSGGHP